jgi:hypothetical protein
MNMKIIKKYLVLMIVSFGIITACKDESLQVVPVWESAVHGFGAVTSSNSDFLYNDPAVDVDMDLKWISIDGKQKVTKIDVYALFDESYVDVDGNPKIASHGGDDGKLINTYSGATVPANRTAVSFSVSQASLYELYKDAVYDYGNGEVSVFDNPDKPQRNDTQRFMWDDAITVRWELTTEDGRVFKKWGPSVCTEFPGANCQIGLGVVCASDITNPGANGGLYVINMTDTYGDGWNGAAIKVIIDGVATEYTLDDGAAGVTNVQVAPTATTIKFEFVSGDWDSEVIYTIKSPKGNTIAKAGPSPAEGPIKLDLCLE